MGIIFKKLEDSYKTEIYKDDLFIGHVDYEIFSNRWSMQPAFYVPHTFGELKDEKFISSYKAGKELINLHDFCYPDIEEYTEDHTFGSNLEDILTYLKTRD